MKKLSITVKENLDFENSKKNLGFSIGFGYHNNTTLCVYYP